MERVTESTSLADATYSVGEAARVLGLSPRRVAQLCDAGGLGYRRTSLGWRLIDKRTVDALAAAKEDHGTT